MFESLNRVDWDLPYQQKLTLLATRDRHRDGSAEYEALSGIPDPLMIHMGDTDNTAYHDGWLGKYVLYTRP